MSEYERKYAAAIAEVEKGTSILAILYAPPGHIFCRKLGLRVRPPHYSGFFTHLIRNVVVFTIFFVPALWMTTWGETHTPFWLVVLSAAFLGVVVGAMTSMNYAHERNNWKLSRLGDL